MIEQLLNEQTLMFFVIAVVFTAVGYVWGLRTQLKSTVASTIDNLINEGYLKTRGTGKDMVVLKWREWENDKTN
jgi:anthranilate phosphoribosyltransferase